MAFTPLDKAPFPADWALSRFVDIGPAVRGVTYTNEEEILQRYRRTMLWRTPDEVISMNARFLYGTEEYQCVPIIYRRLLHHTKVLTTTVSDLVRAASRFGLSMWAEAAKLLVDYSVSILSSKNIGMEKFLHSQRESIYWMLDDALLRICLDQWENDSKRQRWDEAIMPILRALGEAVGQLQGWLDDHLGEMKNFYLRSSVLPERLASGYFRRLSEFLRESARVFEIERTVRLSRIGKLPVELADIIITDVLSFEKVRVDHDLRTAYLSKGKGKAFS